MDSESTNLPSGGSDNARPSDDLSKSLTLDDAASLDVAFDDDEDQGEVAPEAGTETDRETDEAPESQEADEEGETEEADAEEAETPKEETPVITLKDGTKLTLEEVQSGYMRDRDYRLKTQQLADQRRSVETLQTTLQATTDAVVDFLLKQIPPPPEFALSLSDPLAHYQQMQAHDAAVKQILSVIEQSKAVKEVGIKLTAEQQQEVVQRENAALLEKLPHLKDRAKFETFAKEITSFAQDLGFSADELAGLMDHRQILALHYARKGMMADKAKATVQQKVAKAPPVTLPNKATKPASPDSARQEAARRQFYRTGSIHDAAKLSW